METVSAVLLLAAGVLVLILLLKILAAPIRLIFKLLLNAALGFVILFAVNFLGAFFGLSLEVNLLSCLLAGVLGVPGVVLLILLHFLF